MVGYSHTIGTVQSGASEFNAARYKIKSERESEGRRRRTVPKKWRVSGNTR